MYGQLDYWIAHDRIWSRARGAEELYRGLKERGVLVRYMKYPGWGDGLRITVGTDEQMAVLFAKLKVLL